ncbi:unnamed protein product [Lactuca saligna]|uniref:Uncharacterized protein n=1 Tax=Lactuca saligna TaxID=75948 RepID=A0AA35YW62_LACSI|nr:unnamed protein product [Lactuca saligna]
MLPVVEALFPLVAAPLPPPALFRRRWHCHCRCFFLLHIPVTEPKEKLMGKPPTQYDVFVKTHGTVESKKKYFEGNHENIEYCLQTAKEALEGYLQGLVNKFGENPSNRKDDIDVWEESQLRRKGKKKGDIYGIGASDIHFLVLGTPSSQSTQSDSTQQEVDRLRAQVSVMEQQQQQQQMKEQMEMVMRMINMSGNQPRGPPDNPPEDN